MFKIKDNRGFTLVELLVVISIISIISSIILVNLEKARAKTRDAIRLNNLAQLRGALEAYHEDYYVYPSTNGKWMGEAASCGSDPNYSGGNSPGWYSGASVNNWIPGLVDGKYISALPTDPKQNIPMCMLYLYRSNGTDYKILINYTVETVLVNHGDPFSRFPAGPNGDRDFCSPADPDVADQPYKKFDGYAMLSVYSPGAACW